MSSIVTSILSSTVGLLWNKARDSTAAKLKDGDVTDAKIREIVVRDLNDIKTKIDCLSRENLLTSYDFLQEGVDFLNISLDESKLEQNAVAVLNDDRGETSRMPSGVVESHDILNEVLKLSHAMGKMKINSDNEFESAKERFKDARKTATHAFNNVALSIQDRIFAAKLRIISQILECLDSPETAIIGCLSFLKKLHSLPAIQEMFSVYLNGGVKSLLNKAERVENVKSVMLINYVLFQYVLKFTSKYCSALAWPTIELTERCFYPILEWLEISTRKSMNMGEELTQHPNRLAIDESIDSHVSAVNSHGDVVLTVKLSGNIKIVSRRGEIKVVDLPDPREGRVIEQSVEGLAVDKNNNVYVVRYLKTRTENVDVNSYVLNVLDENYNVNHDCTLDFLEARHFYWMRMAITKNNDIIMMKVNGNDVKTASHRHVVSLIRKTGLTLVMKLISVDNGEHFHKGTNSIAKPSPSGSPPANQSPPSEMMPPPAIPTSGNGTSANQGKRSSVIVNGTGHVDGSADKKPPPIPSRAPTTSLSKISKSNRMSVTDMDFENTPAVQEDRIISIPRERISSNEQQWHSPLTGYSSLPRRPKSSYGAIIGSPHASPSDETPSRNFHPVESLDNTGFTTLPSKPRENARRGVSQDDSVVTRRRPGSARSARDRPKSWMPKVLPTEPPPISPPIPREQPTPKQSDDPRPVSRTDSKRDKKRRFSFRKKKEKDYMATTAPEPTEPSDEPGDEGDVVTNDTTENLHIEGEESRPNLLPGLHKRLSTFKPVTVPHRQVVHNDAVSPELSQALEKRKARGFSSGTDETVSPVFSPGYEVPVFPPAPNQAPPYPPRAKSLEESIKEEMMRRRSNTAPSSSIPAKPRRTFEYRKSNGEPLPEGEEAPEEMGGLDSELAKAVARRAAKMTTAPKTDSHIYENVQHLNINASREPRSSVEEPPTLSIEEKLKKLHLDGEVILPTKFKPPVAPPSGKSTRAKPPVEPPNEKATSPGNVPPSGVSTHGNVPPKTFPKPKKRSPSTTSDSGSDDVVHTSRPMTLPLLTSPQTTSLPPPLLSPEMVATQLLDDVINEEVKRSNWDTASWKDKDLSSGKSSPTLVNGAATTNGDTSPTTPGSSTPSRKKKYVYKITLVTEKQADGSEQTQTVTQVITREPKAPQLASPGDSELPPLPAQPPPEFLDESPMPAPVFTPPTSPGAEFSNPSEFTPPPPPSFSPPPPPIIEDVFPPTEMNVEIAPSPSSPRLPPPVAFQEEASSSLKPLSTSEPSISTQDQVPPVSQEPHPNPPIEQSTLPPKETQIHPPISIPAPLPQPESEETTCSSSLPVPVIPPPHEDSLNQDPPFTSGTLPPPEEFKEDKSNHPAVVPPPVFSDSTDGQNVNSNETSTSENQGFDLKEDESSVSMNSKTAITVSNIDEDAPANEQPSKENVQGQGKTEDRKSLVKHSTEENLQAQAETGEPKSFAEPPKEVRDIEENLRQTSEGNSQSQVKSEDSAIGESSKVVSLANENSSRVIPAEEVQALPESKDQNENVVEAPTAYAGNKEEQAPPKTVESDVSTDGSSCRETPYENWTCAHVCDWLASIGMAEHGDLFQENDIRGSNLLGLTKEDLRELGVKKLGHRMTIANEVNRLTTNNGAATNL